MTYENIEDNPFTPSFGEVPLVMAGRTHTLAEFSRAFSSSTRRPCLNSIISGARGSGKTALLSLVDDAATSNGWLAVDLVSLPGLLEDAYEQLQLKARDIVGDESLTRITGLTIGPAGVTLDHKDQPRAAWRTRMSLLLDQLGKHGIGALFTIDEINPGLDELIQFVSTYQLFVREGRKVALVMAGLPHNTSRLLSDKSVSFLRRAESIKLSRIPDFEIERALESTFARSERRISKAVANEAVDAIAGFPFMLQLSGFRMWEEGDGAGQIEDGLARTGIRMAKEELKERILAPSYRELSPMDRKFLFAMLEDGNESTVSDIAHRLGKTNSYATQYKNRLLDQGIIGQRGAYAVAFELPLMREFLEEQPQD